MGPYCIDIRLKAGNVWLKEEAQAPNEIFTIPTSIKTSPKAWKQAISVSVLSEMLDGISFSDN